MGQERKIEPTLDEPTSDHAIGFDKSFDKQMRINQINLTEVDNLLTEKQQSLKKKIWDLAKMESLVHADPKLSAVYDEMAENGEEKYGYHYNETIMNMIFNDYVLNSTQYLTKYKQAIPKEKKRRDKSGINALRKKGEEIEKRREEMRGQKKAKRQKAPAMNEASNSITGGGAFETPVGFKDDVDNISKLLDTEAELKDLEKIEVALPGEEKRAYGAYKPSSPNVSSAIARPEENKAVKKPFYPGGKVTAPIMNGLDINTLKEPNKSDLKEGTMKKNVEENLEKEKIDQEVGSEKPEDAVEETTGSASSGAYITPIAWGKEGNLMENEEEKPFGIAESIEEQDAEYLTDPSVFSEYFDRLEEVAPDTGLITTPEQYQELVAQVKAEGRKLNDEDVRRIGGQALYDLALRLANRFDPVGLGWDHYGDTNSLWNYIDQNGGMSLRDLTMAAKEAMQDRLNSESEEMGMSGMFDENVKLAEDHAKSVGEMVNFIINKKGNKIQKVIDMLDDDGIEDLYLSIEAEESVELEEKAVSKSQQQLMGMAYAYKKGELDGEASDEVKKIANSMSDKDLDDFASTKHKGLPDHVKEAEESNQYIITLKHDGGKIRIMTTASSEDEAIQMVLNSEGAPRGAIVDIQKGVNENPMLGTVVGAAAGGAGEAIGNRVADRVGLEEDHAQSKEEKIRYITKAAETLYPNNTTLFSPNILSNVMGDEEINDLYLDMETQMAELGGGEEPLYENQELSREEKIEFIVNSERITDIAAGVKDLNKIRAELNTMSDTLVGAIYDGILLHNTQEVAETMIDPQDDSMKLKEPITSQGGGDMPSGLQVASSGMNEEVDKTMGDIWKSWVERLYPEANVEVRDGQLSLMWSDEENENWNVIITSPNKQNVVLEYGKSPDGSYTTGKAYVNNSEDYVEFSDIESLKSILDGVYAGAMNEAELKKDLTKYNYDLGLVATYFNTLKTMNEEKRHSSLVNVDRLNKDNAKNFKDDLSHSGTKEIIDVTKELEWKDQQTDVPNDPQKLAKDIEKQHLKNTDKGVAFKNKGNSANDAGDEITKRNLSDEETSEVDLMRKGLGDFVYDNEPDERYTERMKRDMGEKEYKKREDRLKFQADAPMYNKDTQPVEDGIEKVQFDKDKSKWNERMGIKETAMTGKYVDELGKTRLFDFSTIDIMEVKHSKNNAFFNVNLDGLGNTYDSKVQVNKGIAKVINEWSFYTDGKEVFVVKNDTSTLLAENEQVEKKRPVNEQMAKMKHLLGYNPKKFTNTKNIKL